MHRETLERSTSSVWQTLVAVEHWTDVFAQIEEPIWRDQCTVVMKALRDFQNAIKQLHDVVLRITQVVDRLRLLSFYLVERPDEVILLIVAYQPSCQSVAERWLRVRRRIAREMRSLVGVADELKQILSSFSLLPRTGDEERHTHLHLVEGGLTERVEEQL